jgi:hypothetical protein
MVADSPGFTFYVLSAGPGFPGGEAFAGFEKGMNFI